MNNFQEKVSFIWSVADLLRGDFKQSEYGKVILPLTVLRRLDCVLEPTKDTVLAKAKALPKNADEKMRDLMLCKAAGQKFYNLSKFTFASLLGNPDQIEANLNNYIAGFSPNAREIFLDKFKFRDQLDRLDESNLLFLVVSKFVEIDLHLDAVDIHEYFKREVLPQVPDAWIDEDKTKKGYEIPFTRHFYQYTPLRPLNVIEAEIKALEGEIQEMLKGVMG